MEAIRKVVKRQGNTITVELPASFMAELVELIVLPLENGDEFMNAGKERQQQESLTELQQNLLSWPVMSDEDYQHYQEKQQGFELWSKQSAK